MPPERQPIQRIFSSRIEPTSVADALSHDIPRAKIIAIIENYVGQVTFEDLVMKYAGKEIERRSLGSIKFWAITILTTIITALITAVITIAVTTALKV